MSKITRSAAPSVLVTGAGGFVGRHLVDALCNQGESVRALDLRYEPDLVNVETVMGSVTDPKAVEKALQGVESVFHCAAIAHLWSSDPNAYNRVNVEGTRTVLEMARKAGVARVVHVSSYVTLMANRFAGQTVDENLVLEVGDMLGPYPVSKFLSERLALDMATDDFHVVVALPSAPVGPLDYGMTPPSKLIADLVNGKIPATMRCRMNLVNVRTLAQGLIAARDRGVSGERYLMTGQDMSMDGFLEKLRKVSGRRMPKAKVPQAVAHAAALIDECVLARLTGRAPGALLTGVRLARTNLQFDNSKTCTELGVDLNGAIEPALQDALDWMRQEHLAPAQT